MNVRSDAWAGVAASIRIAQAFEDDFTAKQAAREIYALVDLGATWRQITRQARKNSRWQTRLCADKRWNKKRRRR